MLSVKATLQELLKKGSKKRLKKGSVILQYYDLANEFVGSNDNRKRNFGIFRESDFVTVSE